MDPHKEEEDKATPLRCEPENLVEEQATKVFVQKDGKMKEMDDKSSDFCKIDVHLKPSDPWEEENTSLASEYCKMKDNCERDEFTPSLSVGEQKIDANKCDVVNGDKGYFVSYPK